MAPKSQKPFKRTATFLLLTAAKDHPVPVFDTHKLGVLSQWLNLSRLGLLNALFDIMIFKRPSRRFWDFFAYQEQHSNWDALNRHQEFYFNTPLNFKK